MEPRGWRIFSTGADCASTLACLRVLGVNGNGGRFEGYDSRVARVYRRPYRPRLWQFWLDDAYAEADSRRAGVYQ